ncbi:MAG: PSD1 and planctomycete cytochrome C domain-containing protein [Aeoliella sp.]
MRCPFLHSLRLSASSFLLLTLSLATHAKEPTVAAIDFAHQVVPILKQHCMECHGGEEAEGGFSINSRALMLDADVVKAGDSDDSLLVELITSADLEVQMPPKDRPRMPAESIAVVRRWIDEGMIWEPGYSFAKKTYEPPLRPRRPTLPPVVNGRTNPIDRIVDAYLSDQGVAPSQKLDDAQFLRRVSLDLVGLVPSPEQVDAFASDRSPDKRARLIDDLLNDNVAYAEHWLTMWNDLLRNNYVGTGYIDGGRTQISSWLYRSLLENKPYDHFARELVSPTEESAGFIRGIKWRGEVNASQQREIQFAQTVPQVFLGINLKCASCHDSFIDRWKLEETYALAAVYSDRELEIHRCDKPTGKMANAGWLFPELGQVDATLSPAERLEQLAQLMTHAENGRFTRTVVNRLWRQLMGRGIVHPVDAMHTEPWSEDLLDQLAMHLSDHDYDLKSVLSLIVNSHAYQSQTAITSLESVGEAYRFEGPIAKRMTAEQYIDAVWTITGAGPKKPHKEASKFLIESERPVRASLVSSDLLMRSLGRPNREQVVSSRPELLTTLQALDLSNSPTLVKTLRKGAQHLLQQHAGETPHALIEQLYLQSLARRPRPEEQLVAHEIVGDELTERGIEDLLWALLMLPEFQVIR